jgi:hypothetical protein
MRLSNQTIVLNIRAINQPPAFDRRLDQPGTVPARIAVRPTWAGLIDFASRLPAPGSRVSWVACEHPKLISAKVVEQYSEKGRRAWPNR